MKFFFMNQLKIVNIISHIWTNANFIIPPKIGVFQIHRMINVVYEGTEQLLLNQNEEASKVPIYLCIFIDQKTTKILEEYIVK